MRLWKALGLTLLLAVSHMCVAGEPPTLDEVVAQLTGKTPMSERTKAKLKATQNTVLGLLLPKLGGDNLDEREQAQTTCKAICWHAARPGADAERTALAEAIVGRLTPKLPKPALLFLLRQLENVGRDESVELLTRILNGKDPLLRERARLALLQNSSEKATAPLRSALGKANGADWKIALINALGARKSRAAVRDLIPLTASTDDGVRVAACDALARIGDGTAATAIAKATTIRGSDRAWHAICRAYLLLADTLAAQDRKADALPMYRKFLTSPGHLRCAAIVGLGRAGGPEELPTLLNALDDADVEIRGAARGALDLMPVEAIRQALTQTAATASPAMKAQLLKILVRRADPAAAPAFLAALRDPAEEVRLVAYDGIGRLAGPEAVGQLIAALGRAKGREREAVRTAIGQMKADGVNAALATALDKADGDIKPELIALLADRGATSAAPKLLVLAKGQDGAVRDAALKALGALADAEALPTLVDLLVKAKDRGERAAAERAVVGICSRVEDETQRAKPIVAALGPTKDAALRVSLVRLLGRIGGSAALEALRAASKDADEKVQDAAVRSLADWQSAKAAADLLRIATTGKTLVHHVLALRGYVRLVGLPSDRSAAETLKLYDDALQVARRPDEKRLILAGIATVADPAALKKVEPFLTNADLSGEAAMATARIAAGISGTSRDAAKAALENLLKTSQDKAARKLATDTLAQIDRFADYLTAWEVAGPYTKPGADGPACHNAKFAPEEQGKEAKWETMPPGGDNPPLPFLMDFYKRYKKENAVAYLRTQVWSPKAQAARLEFGSDDGAKVWLNGKLVVDARSPRSFKEAEDKKPVALKQGWNTLLVKVWNGGTHWGAAARFRSPDGGPLDGLRASIKPD